MSARAPGSGAGTTSEGKPSLLVTGAAGFIGSHLCDRLLNEGQRVWALDNFDDFYDAARKRKNLRSALQNPAMHLVEGDVRDAILLEGLMSDVAFGAVIHLAARPGIRESIEDPATTFDVNVRGTLTLLEAIRRHEIPVLLFASSSGVYGEADPAPYREDAAADRPISPCAASKRTGELLCYTYHHLHELTVHCLRLSPVYGPRQRPDLQIHEFARCLEDGRPVSLSQDSAARDYLYVDDAVDGMLLSLERARSRDGDGPEYRVINLGGREAVGLAELVDDLSEALGVALETEGHRVSAPRGGGTDPASSPKRAAELLGYAPVTGMAQGLDRFVAWLRSRDPLPTQRRRSP